MAQQTKINDREFLRMAAELLNRINADAKFAKAFDQDPAGALQRLFPQLAEVPKKRIASALDAHMKQLGKVLEAVPQLTAAQAVGMLSLLARAAMRLTSTYLIRSASKLLITALASEMVCRALVYSVVEPIPE